jgi:porin
VNGRVAQAEELQNAAGLGPVAVQRSEYVSELYYSLHATPWLILRPNFQYILQPGGVGQREDGIILGLKLALKI